MTDISSTVTVLDKDGETHEYDADDWHETKDGCLVVTKDGQKVAVYAPGQGKVLPGE